MSNHQTLIDWLYLWSIAHCASLGSAINIILKREIKWIPFVGWACQFYDFIFVSRSWLEDKAPLLAGLRRVGISVRQDEEKGKLALLIFPEGTLVTGNVSGLSELLHTHMHALTLSSLHSDASSFEKVCG